MKHLFEMVRRRMWRGIRLSGDEHETIEKVQKRIRKALKKHKGIRLSKDELRVLGLYGLQQQAEEQDDWDD
ncbi:hypothetical protein [Adhaeretor mobilis]|uniref:Uncharacterized protein n=1 Tax=Adhaeretor mobilis TaxID=1930276 RepID=A0A517N2F5_9BACT|nr:hypothetical protein [Adhaeretor mobilis]QDT01312.1 hypothetical protein HG15A2_46540 [Adhaeretor mobilis]